MPVWLRKFYYKKTEEAITAANKANPTKKINKPRIARPGIGP